MAGDGEGAIFLGTFLSDGTSVTVCEAHFTEFLASTLEMMTGAPVVAMLTLHLEESISAGVDDSVAPDYDELITEEWFMEHHSEIAQAAMDNECDVASAAIYVWDQLHADDVVEHHVVTDADVDAIALAAATDDTDSTLAN